MKQKCGDCGYFMRYVDYSGKPEHDGDCGSIAMNKECNDGVNPFRVYYDDERYVPILQVDEKKDACALFKTNRTKRVRNFIKEHHGIYFQKRIKNNNL